MEVWQAVYGRQNAAKQLAKHILMQLRNKTSGKMNNHEPTVLVIKQYFHVSQRLAIALYNQRNRKA